MTRDQVIGAVILIVCLAILVGYLADVILIAAFKTSWIAWVLGMVGLAVDPFSVFIWLIAIPVIVAFSAVLIIGAWIGFTMATTPPPAPIEELETELEAGLSAEGSEEVAGEEEKREEST